MSYHHHRWTTGIWYCGEKNQNTGGSAVANDYMMVNCKWHIPWVALQNRVRRPFDFLIKHFFWLSQRLCNLWTILMQLFLHTPVTGLPCMLEKEANGFTYWDAYSPFPMWKWSTNAGIWFPTAPAHHPVKVSGSVIVGGEYICHICLFIMFRRVITYIK